jgi:hypothetical protein
MMKTLLILTLFALLVYAVTHMLRSVTPTFTIAPVYTQIGH